MELFFPDLVRSIDATAELKRVNSIQFASADRQQKSGDLSQSKKSLADARRGYARHCPQRSRRHRRSYGR